MSIAYQKRNVPLKHPISYFNELFFEFTKELSGRYKMENGFLFVDPAIWPIVDDLDIKWRSFSERIKSNGLYKASFKYFLEQVTNHIERLKDQALFHNYYKIKIEFMHTIEIPDIKFKTEIPSEIEEMNRKQFITLSGLLAQLLNKEITYDQLKTKMVFTFLKIRSDRVKYERLAADTKFDISANVYKIAELLDYFFILEDDKVKINLKWTKNFIRRIRSGFRFYHGPVDALTDITFLEYKDANSFFRKYSETHEEADLNRMIAVLYRPKIMGYKFKYNPDKIEKQAERISKVPFKIRFGIFLFYTACEEFLRYGTFQADGNPINLSILYEISAKEKKLMDKVKHKDETGLAGLANNLAKTGIYGTVEKVYSQNLYDVLILLYQQRIEYLNQIENMEVK